jgi:hypothetical protein
MHASGKAGSLTGMISAATVIDIFYAITMKLASLFIESYNSKTNKLYGITCREVACLDGKLIQHTSTVIRMYMLTKTLNEVRKWC